jgi:hypothetical protein
MTILNHVVNIATIGISKFKEIFISFCTVKQFRTHIIGFISANESQLRNERGRLKSQPKIFGLCH